MTMASPRRARSLFLSPDKAELLAAREVSNLVHRVEVVPHKSVPRQGRRTDIAVETDSGDESRMSTTSTIKAVDTFCREYRPPSIALHRLSYLNKELPPPPPPESPTQSLHQSNARSRTSTQKHAAAQTNVSIQSRYSTRIKPSTPSRLSIISSQQRESEDCVSIRSRFSTQDPPTGSAVSRSEPRASVAIDRRRPSGAGENSRKDIRRQNSGSISDAIPHHEIVPTGFDREIEVLGSREAEIDPWALQAILQEPLTGTKSKEIVPRSKSKRKASVGWTFHDGFILRTDDRLKSTTGTSSEGENLVLEPRSKPMVPIRWMFHDGILFRADESPKNGEVTSEAKSKRMIPIGWSFYDGLTIRPDGSVKAISKATGKSEEVVPRSKSKRMIPIGWTFHEGLIFAADDWVKSALKSSDKSSNIEMEARSKRLPIAWTFHDGLILRTDAKVKDATKTAPNIGEVATRPKSKRTVGWTFNDGLIIRNCAGKSPSNGELATRTKSKRTIGWTFHDGLIIRRDGGIVKRFGQNRGITTSTKSKRMPVSWSFYDGLTFKQRSTSKGKGKGVDRNLHPLVPRSKSVQRRRITYNFWDGVKFTTIDEGSTRVSAQPKSKLTWSFYDGITRKTIDEASGQVSTQPKPKRAYGWTFHDGLTIKPTAEAEPLPKAASPFRALKSIAPVTSPSPQPKTKGISNLPDQPHFELPPNKTTTQTISKAANEPILNEEQLDLSPKSQPLPPSSSRGSYFPKQPSTKGVSHVPKGLVLSEGQLDLSPKSRPLPASSSSSGGSYPSAQPGASDADLASFQDRHRRPPASRANAEISPPTDASETRYFTIVDGKAASADASKRSTPIDSEKATSPGPSTTRGKKPSESKAGIEIPPESRVSRRKELLSPAISKYNNENGSATRPAIPIRRKDVPPPAPGVSKYHIENGKAVPTTTITTTDPRPQAQALAARRKDMLAGCFWSRDAVVDKAE